MAQQPQSASQIVLGPASNGGGDIIHITPANANAAAGAAFAGWVDKNNLAQGVSGSFNALSNGAASPITAAAGGVFSTSAVSQLALNLPGVGAYEQIPFTVKASGFVSLGAGTYTATVQPLIYASTTPGFTAAAASAVYSVAAVSVTQASASALVFPWEAEVTIQGDSTSGKLNGRVAGMLNNGAQQITALAGISNAPTAVSFSAAVPLQFAAGVTLTNSAATSIVSLGSFFLES